MVIFTSNMRDSVYRCCFTFDVTVANGQALFNFRLNMVGAARHV